MLRPLAGDRGNSRSSSGKGYILGRIFDPLLRLHPYLAWRALVVVSTRGTSPSTVGTRSSLRHARPGGGKAIPDKLTDAEKRENKVKAHPEISAAKKEKNDACREKRAASGSTKSFS